MRQVVYILIGLALGLLAGLALNFLWTAETWASLGVGDASAFLAGRPSDANAPTVWAKILGWVVHVNQFVGDTFIRCLRFAAVPIVLFTLVSGAASIGDVRKVGRVGGKTMLIYFGTTVVAVVVGLAISNVVGPGRLVSAESRERLISGQRSAAADLASKTGQLPSLWDQMANMVPRNPFDSLARGDMLQVIVFSLAIGIVLTMIPKERSAPVVHFFEVMGEVIGRIVTAMMFVAPVAVFCLIVPVAASMGADAVRALGAYCICVVGGLVLLMVVEYSALVWLLGRMRPGVFFRGIGPAQLVAFSSSSSSATLPVTMDCAVKRLGVPKRIASFVCPLGATVNMDGTALYQGVAVVFIAQALGVDLNFEQQLSVVIAATLASIGSPGIPGGSLVFLIAILQSIGLPAEGIALILGVDRLLDMARTVVNVTGDAMVSVIVARGEREESHSPDA